MKEYLIQIKLAVETLGYSTLPAFWIVFLPETKINPKSVIIWTLVTQFSGITIHVVCA